MAAPRYEDRAKLNDKRMLREVSLDSRTQPTEEVQPEENKKDLQITESTQMDKCHKGDEDYTQNIPMGCVLHRARPLSPTGVTDFPPCHGNP